MKSALKGMMVICLLLIGSGNSRGQDEGQIVDVATDPMDEVVIPSLTVMATEAQTNFIRTAVTNTSAHSESVFQNRKGDL